MSLAWVSISAGDGRVTAAFHRKGPNIPRADRRGTGAGGSPSKLTGNVCRTCSYHLRIGHLRIEQLRIGQLKDEVIRHDQTRVRGVLCWIPAGGAFWSRYADS